MRFSTATGSNQMWNSHRPVTVYRKTGWTGGWVPRTGFLSETLIESGYTFGILSGAKQAAEKGHISGRVPERRTSGAKALADSIGFMPGINPQPTARRVLSAACKARASLTSFVARLKAAHSQDIN